MAAPKKKAPPRFTRGVIADVKKRFETARTTPQWVGAYDIENLSRSYNLEAFNQDGVLYWSLRYLAGSGDGIVGAGWFRYQTRPRRVLSEERAALFSAHQGRGLYPLILKDLRRVFKRPLESDRKLTDHNRRVWAKLGAYDTASGRYQINPRRRGRVIPVEQQVRWAWVVMEGKVPRSAF
jgi:hypothetical protein